MTCERFREIVFRAASLKRIEVANEILEEYHSKGIPRLTLRQLYYQFVARDLIENSEKSYKNLGNLISDGRLAGLISWEAIEDRVRVPKAAADWTSASDLIDSACRQFRLPRWEGQDNYVELWVEKDALAGVLWPIAHRYHVTLMVNRGYSSQSAMFESAARFREAEEEREAHLLYVGDHDPSGEDMVRDVEERLNLFGAAPVVTKLALTMPQIKEYKPPPNPAKKTDSRFVAYRQKHGTDKSWEVDALPPDVLTRIIRRELDTLVDQATMDQVIAREEAIKGRLTKYAKRLGEP